MEYKFKVCPHEEYQSLNNYLWETRSFRKSEFIMAGKKILVVFSLLCLAAVALAGVLEPREKPKEPENEKKKPNILKDYICMRDGELCHPEFAKNRGMYVSCSNGIAWEQTCPKCAYHAISCPTKNLWFDGEKCEWASPKLASQPCIDKMQLAQEGNATNIPQPHPHPQGSHMTEQKNLFTNLESSMVLVPIPEQQQSTPQVEKNKWPVKPIGSNLKYPKVGLESLAEPSQYLEVNEFRGKLAEGEKSDLDQIENAEKSMDEMDSLQPFLTADDAKPLVGSKIIRLNEPVYTLVDSANGNGKHLLKRVSQPFFIEEPAKEEVAALPNPNIISVVDDKVEETKM